MSGIPRYNNAPLNARSGAPVPPTGPSPHPSQASQTASASSPLTNPNPNTTSSSPPLVSTGSSRSCIITGTDKPQPTRTIKEDSEVPPAPQPAAFPKPTTGFAGDGYASQVKTVVPPPPRAGHSTSTMPRHTHAGQREVDGVDGGTLQCPLQMNIPPPSVTRAPFSSTMTGTESADTEDNASSTGFCWALHMRNIVGTHDRVGNAYAAELSSDQRRALDVHEGERGRNRSASGSMGVFGGGGGGGGGSTDDGGEDEGIWGSAKRWVGSAGSKLSEGEKEVWRRINGH
ncbi:hypothetical protein EYC84_007740 [Monilinia fructicola]|uniref:Uncharacterized protein n=1 Tax=Monilinia fructicola TaxID=38448 RepID=A0A5M9JP14_MONFR|nr:hypothetical protein EYC84_007740 [Monilinia fructicola]